DDHRRQERRRVVPERGVLRFVDGPERLGARRTGDVPLGPRYRGPVRTLLAIAVSLTLVGCSSASGANGGLVRVEDRPLPALEGKGLDGAPLSAAAFRGKVLVVSVWATWCLDCERDQPGFVRVAGRYTNRGVAF